MKRDITIEIPDELIQKAVKNMVKSAKVTLSSLFLATFTMVFVFVADPSYITAFLTTFSIVLFVHMYRNYNRVLEKAENYKIGDYDVEISDADGTVNGEIILWLKLKTKNN